MRIILGSNSPRRKEILNFFSLPYVQVTPEFDEESVTFSGDPAAHACLLAQGKAESLSGRFSEPILTADTLVFREGRLFPKPIDEAAAAATLAALSGGWHSVFTAVCGVTESKRITQVEETRVLLENLTPLQIRRYHQSLHCADKAGAYAIQGAGSLIVRRVEGCYYNVVGMPIGATARVLAAMGIDLWDYLKPL
jgi:septum formation protein